MSMSNHAVFVPIKYFFFFSWWTKFSSAVTSLSDHQTAGGAISLSDYNWLFKVSSTKWRNWQKSPGFTQSCDWHLVPCWVALICDLGLKVAPLCLEILWNGSTIQAHSAMFIRWPETLRFSSACSSSSASSLFSTTETAFLSFRGEKAEQPAELCPTAKLVYLTQMLLTHSA